MINLQDLENAFSPITEIGREELTFEACGRSMTVRQVPSEEEVEVSRYARVHLEQVAEDAPDSDKEAALQSFLDRFKIGILSYAIVEIDDMDLRDVDFIPTGEVLDNGVPVRITKFQAIEKIISGWPRNVLNSVYVMYGELSTRIELKAEKVIHFKHTDLDAEIERLETRLADLKKAKAEQGKGPRDPLAEKVKAVNSVDVQTKNIEDRMTEARQTVGADRVLGEEETVSQVSHPEPDDEPPVVVTSAPSRTQDEAPVSSPPPVSVEVRQANNDHLKRRRTAIPEAATSPGVDHRAVRAAEEAAASPDRFDNIYDSMADINDESMLAAEEARLAAARAARMAQDPARPAPVPPSEMDPAVRQAVMESRREASRQEATGGIRRANKTPPHRFAAEAADAIMDTGAGDIRPSTSTPLGKLGGVDAYRMPMAEVSRRTHRDMAGADISVDEHAPQSTNDKFNPRLRKVQPKKKKGRRGMQTVDLNKRGGR